MIVPKPAIELQDIAFCYGDTDILKDITLTVETGVFYGLIGPNGSGKSTLLDILSGYLPPQHGRIEVQGRPIANYSKNNLALVLTSVPQSFSMNFQYRVADVVMMGRHPYIPRFAKPSPRDIEKVEEALVMLEISHLTQRPVSNLSGGEKQRVMLARALAQDTEVLLLDEVTANLDISHAIAIMQIISHLTKTYKKTVIAAIHDLNLAAAFCTQIIALNDGRIVDYGTTNKVLTSGLIEDIFQVSAEISSQQNGQCAINYSYT